MRRDYSQLGDPYGLAEYTEQSADTDVVRQERLPLSGQVDIRGNPVCVPRGIPTQAECDAVKAEA